MRDKVLTALGSFALGCIFWGALGAYAVRQL